MTQAEKATRFADLHVPGEPFLLYNVWDAGSAKAIVDAGAAAVATSSWSMAEAQGYHDGEGIPIAFAEQIIARIAVAVDVPVSADFEGGYSDDNGELADNAARLLNLGVIGINFEDRIMTGAGLYDIDRQAGRINAIRTAAEQSNVELFINARTDLFLGQGNEPAGVIGEAIDRAKAYAQAGASGFFVPGLQEEELIEQICKEQNSPVNIMVMDGVPSVSRLAELGVARISWGPIPYINTMATLTMEAKGL